MTFGTQFVIFRIRQIWSDSRRGISDAFLASSSSSASSNTTILRQSSVISTPEQLYANIMKMCLMSLT